MGGSARRLDPQPRRQDAAPEEDDVQQEEDIRPSQDRKQDVQKQEEEEVAVRCCGGLLKTDGHLQSRLADQASWSLSRMP